MTAKPPQKSPQKALRKNLNPQSGGKNELIRLPGTAAESLAWWVEQYFKFEVTTAASSQAVQRRDLGLFVEYLNSEAGSDAVRGWTPRLARSFQDALRKQLEVRKEKTVRRFSDRTINRVIAHLKTFSKWIHKLKPFPLGDPMVKLASLPVGSGMEIERAVTVAERRKLLDAADLLLRIGGESRDRKRFKAGERPKRKGYRAYRNRAIIYCLLETGMRRAAVRNLNLDDIHWKKKTLEVREKGGLVQRYQISAEGLQAIRAYVDEERGSDAKYWKSPALFLAASTVAHGDGRLSVVVINSVWNEVAARAGVEGRTPHSARHAMGRHIIEKTGNIAAVQRQLGHKNAAYSMQYARITERELADVLEDR
jgi:integrase